MARAYTEKVMAEIWERYSIDKKGNVFRLKSGKQKKHTFCPSNGYMHVALWVKNKSKSCLVHRLLAIKYIENPLGLPFINHIDGDKRNNDLKNLEWCTQSYNTRHAMRLGLVKTSEKSHMAKLKNRDVLFIRECLSRKIVSCSSLGMSFNVTTCCIRKIRDGKSWRHLKGDRLE